MKPEDNDESKSFSFNQNSREIQYKETVMVEIAKENLDNTQKRLKWRQQGEQFILNKQLEKDQYIQKLQQSAQNIPQQSINNKSSSIESFELSKPLPNIESLEINGNSIDEKKEVQQGQIMMPQSLIKILEDFSIIENQSAQLTNLEKLPFAIPLKQLGINVNTNNFEQACFSFVSMTDKLNIFTKNPQTHLFSLNFIEKKNQKNKIGKKLLTQIQNANKYLLNEILISLYVKLDKLVELFKIQYQSFQILTLERFWKKGFYQEHGLQFIGVNNIKNLKRIILKGDYLSSKMVQSLKYVELVKLQILELRFMCQVEDKELVLLLQNTEPNNPDCRIQLLTSRISKNQLYIEQKYKEKIDFIQEDNNYIGESNSYEGQ